MKDSLANQVLVKQIKSVEHLGELKKKNPTAAIIVAWSSDCEGPAFACSFGTTIEAEKALEEMPELFPSFDMQIIYPSKPNKKAIDRINEMAVKLRKKASGR